MTLLCARYVHKYGQILIYEQSLSCFLYTDTTL